MKILKKIGIALLAIILLVTIISFFLPSKIRVERSIVINAPTEVIFDQINNFRNWKNWSPWDKKDSTMKKEFFGPEQGVGAGYKWESNHKEVGNGSQTIVASVPNDSIYTALNFMDNGKGESGFKFNKEGDATQLTWYMLMDMGMNPINKIKGLFIDKFLAPDFEAGLNSLKILAESLPKTEVNVIIEEVEIAQQYYLSYLDTCTEATIGKTLESAYTLISTTVEEQKLAVNGPPFAFYHSFAPDKVIVEAALPIATKPSLLKGQVTAGELKTTKAIRGSYMGPYSGLQLATMKVLDYAKVNNKKIMGSEWDTYITDPSTEKDSTKWLTLIHFPIQ